jgi:hypothetical protein
VNKTAAGNSTAEGRLPTLESCQQLLRQNILDEKSGPFRACFQNNERLANCSNGTG